MTSAVEIDGIDRAALDVRVEDDTSLIVVTEPDDVSNELFRFDAGERRVEIVGVAYVDRIDPGHTRIHDEGVELFAAESIRTHLQFVTDANTFLLPSFFEFVFPITSPIKKKSASLN